MSIIDPWVKVRGDILPAPNPVEYNNKSEANSHFWKFNEGKILKKIEEYLKTTYHAHYNDENKNVQTIEKLRSDRVAGFCVGNMQKYLDRYDKKGTPKQDLLKVAHYLIFLLNHEDIYD